MNTTIDIWVTDLGPAEVQVTESVWDGRPVQWIQFPGWASPDIRNLPPIED
jgi:hypothetical protein